MFVCARNIEELQEQNQKLLAVIRELSEKNEMEENSAIDTKSVSVLTYKYSLSKKDIFKRLYDVACFHLLGRNFFL